MSVRLSDDEAWEFLAAGHTGILTTLRRDGAPVALPIWFVVHDRRIYVGTPAGSKKIQRIEHDPRASFLVESGDAWVELAAVHLPVYARVLDPATDGAELAAVAPLFTEKYAAFRPKPKKMPDATKKHYGTQAVIRLDPTGAPVSWDNSRIRLRASTDESAAATDG